MCHVTPRVSVYVFLIFGLQHYFYFYLPHFFFTFDLKGFFSVVVEMNYCNNSKKKKENGGQDEIKEGKERRKGGKGKGRNEREKNI
jgi:hypothetical protein